MDLLCSSQKRQRERGEGKRSPLFFTEERERERERERDPPCSSERENRQTHKRQRQRQTERQTDTERERESYVGARSDLPYLSVESRLCLSETIGTRSSQQALSPAIAIELYGLSLAEKTRTVLVFLHQRSVGSVPRTIRLTVSQFRPAIP